MTPSVTGKSDPYGAGVTPGVTGKSDPYGAGVTPGVTGKSDPLRSRSHTRCDWEE